jgi:hypothetical protein
VQNFWNLQAGTTHAALPSSLQMKHGAYSKGKGKAHPLQAMQAQRGLGELRLLDFLTLALHGGRLSASRTGRLFFTRG